MVQPPSWAVLEWKAGGGRGGAEGLSRLVGRRGSQGYCLAVENRLAFGWKLPVASRPGGLCWRVFVPPFPTWQVPAHALRQLTG